MVKIQFQIILIQFLKISFPQAVLALKNAYFQVLGTPRVIRIKRINADWIGLIQI
jgi:hypothetical protein